MVARRSLKARSATVAGILNGVDYNEWSPEKDTHIARNYSPDDLDSKFACKKDLLTLYGIKEVNPKIPVIGIVGRFAAQKGFDLIAQAADRLAREELVITVLGTGDRDYEDLFRRLTKQYPQKIAVNGASAGGHLAAATAMFDFDEAGEDVSVSCVPNALMLFSPVIDTSKEGYGNAKAGERWEELSPAHKVRPAMPPTILFHGTADTTTPFKGAQLFHDAMLRTGNRSELVKVEGAIHTYMFKDAALYADTLRTQ